MYYIKGNVVQEKTTDFILVENNNIGYKILTNETPKLNEEIKIFVKTIYLEDEEFIVGFSQEIELDVFSVLIEVNGIGHKTALKILNQINYKNLLYYSINDLHSEMLKINHINIENYLAIATKLKKKFKNVKFEIKDTQGKRCELYKMLKSLGIGGNLYEKVAFLENENISLKEKLARALKIINDR